MASYDEDLLAAAGRLVARRKGQRGKLAGARIRRSLSTSYYAIFHFLVEDCCVRLLGSSADLRRRRRVLARSFAHSGIRAALDKVKGAYVDQSLEDFLRSTTAPTGRVPSPAFVQNVAKTFSDALAKRHDADYDMNKPLSEADERLVRARVKAAIAGWRSANGAADRDFKTALCMLMLLKGQLRREN
jgi:hypothetical protein